jgi:hypothetical protein
MGCLFRCGVFKQKFKFIDMDGNSTHCCQLVNVKLLALLILLVLLTGIIAQLRDMAFRRVESIDRPATSK